MKLRLQTDYALRTLMFLGYVQRKSKAEEIAAVFDISKDHLVKVVQQLARMGFVRTIAGRRGGIVLARDPDQITIREVIEAMEGRRGVFDCVEDPDVCPLEPGCRLRRLLIRAEDAFFETLGGATIAEMYAGRKHGGLTNLVIPQQ